MRIHSILNLYYNNYLYYLNYSNACINFIFTFLHNLPLDFILIIRNIDYKYTVFMFIKKNQSKCLSS